MAKPTRKKTPARAPTPAEVKGYTPEQIWQRLKTDPFLEEFDFDPRCPNFFYVSNLIQRVIARLVAKTDTGYVPITATPEGGIVTVTAGGSLDRYEALSGTGTDAGATVSFAQQVKRLDLLIFDNPAYLKFSRDTVAAVGDQVELWKDSFLSLDLLTRRIWVANKTALSNCRYCFIGYY